METTSKMTAEELKVYRSTKTVRAAKCVKGNKRQLAELGRRSLDGIDYGEWLVLDPNISVSTVMEDDAFKSAYTEDYTAPLTAENAKLREFASFAKSCILSGEPWSETAEAMFKAALDGKGGE